EVWDAFRKHKLLGRWDSHLVTVLELACSIGEGDPARARAYFRSLRPLANDWDTLDQLRTCAEVTALAPHLPTLLPALRQIRGRRFSVFTAQLAYLDESAKGSGEVAPEFTPLRSPSEPLLPSLRRYPGELRDALVKLQQWHRSPEDAAARVLRKDFPDPKELDRQIQNLGGLEQPTPLQQQRRFKLERLRTDPVAPTPGRLEQLDLRLRSAAGRALFELVEREVAAVWKANLFGSLESLPAWAEDVDFVHAIAGIHQLTSPMIELAREVLRRRASDSRLWDFRDHPANQQFLAQLATAGIDPTPWVDDAPVFEESLGGLGPIRVTIERDPLELLHMGRWFDTCLSPGGVSFFSVFTNIADINKQVIYARNASGRVVGRMLVALGPDLRLRTFHCYAHGERELARAQFVRYVTELSERMGVEIGVAERSESSFDPGLAIQKLVGADWYDDGPESLPFLGNELEEGSSFRRELSRTSPEQFLPMLTETFAREDLRFFVIPRVVQLPEVRHRPELLEGLRPLILERRLSRETVCSVVELLIEAKHLPEARAWGRRLEQEVHRFDRWDFDFGCPPLELIFAIDPARALRALLAKQRIRDWPDPSVSYNRNYYAMAIQAYLQQGSGCCAWPRRGSGGGVRS
ncbi:MAG: hypothetical protein KDA27_23005, partial [Candidatus Eisenbacteria bacterium]|nr:hypothetical protein [Candidatus Eisenbacteria bacterium]